MRSALNRKLLRDLWAMRGQAVAIALVIAAGMSMFVMYLSNFDSLRRTQQAFYDRTRFADVFASLKRAPARLADRIAAIPGVAQVETRVAADVVLDVPGLQEPASARLVSVPAAHRPALNDLYVRAGRWVDPVRPDEVLASEAFVRAHGFAMGDHIWAVINGRRRRLTIVGAALSPEYVYSLRPGEIIPDDRRFGVLWMERRALASAFDMEGGFNDVVLALDRGTSPEAVIAQLDRLLAPYGGRGAVPRALQLSHWMLDSELRQLQNFGLVIPLIFLLVAAFVLNVALTRALALQRSQIAALKALGYSNRELSWHYLKMALLMAVLGVAAGVAAGGWLGSAMITLYNEYFRFPVLLYRLSVGLVLGAAALGLGSAALGAITTVRRAVRVPPAEAMRPEPPARYRPSVLERPAVRRHLTLATRMVLRNLERQPFRAAASVLGIAFAGAILLVGFVFVDAMEQLVDTQFFVMQREDVTVTFVEPRSPAAAYALARLPGVIAVEPVRSVPARLRAGPRDRTVAVTGMPVDAVLRRIVDRRGRASPVTPEGLLLSATLAHVLDVAPGDRITLEVLEGGRPIREVPVAGLVEDTLGLSAYMALDALHRLMRESAVLSGAALRIDSAQEEALAARLKALPAVAGVAFKRATVESFQETLAANMNLMITFNVLFAGIIACGVVYNAARVSLSERSRELASLRVLGFTRGEISLVLLEELALLTWAALPVGALLGYGLAVLIVASLESEVYRFPLVVTSQAVAWSALIVVGASILSGLIVRRRLDRLDLVGVLKSQE
jgi:putative ABC transport system permease protein